MSNFWLLSAIAIGLLTVGIAFVTARRSNDGRLMKDFLLFGLAPALSIIAFNEFIVVPTWGVEAASSLAASSIVIIILPLSLLMKRRRR